MKIKCIKGNHWFVKVLMFVAWPWESCPNWLNLRIENVRMGCNTWDYVSVKIG